MLASSRPSKPPSPGPAIHDHRYVRDVEGGHLEPQAGAPLLWSRCYEISTNRTIFGDRDQRSMSWYGTTPRGVLDAAPRP